jgi:hypothetical protein
MLGHIVVYRARLYGKSAQLPTPVAPGPDSQPEMREGFRPQTRSPITFWAKSSHDHMYPSPQ